jgi:serine phosphatase RsbU (regulator of sigma subunit)
VRTVVYASAGHDVAFTLADDGRIRHLMPTAPMLGIPLRNHACDATFVLDPTETLVVATDGVGDSRPAGSDHFFGAGGTARAAARSLRSGSNPARAVLEAAYAHGGDYLADDAAAVIVRVRPQQRCLTADLQFHPM